VTLTQALAAAVAQLQAADVPQAARDARRLLAHALGVDAGRITLMLPEDLPAGAQDRFDDLVAQRARRVPVAHLTGNRAFYGRDFLVTPDVLDPRPETETLIATALEKRFTRVLDLGTGSGCILLTLLAETGAETFGIGTDLSREALSVAMTNAGRLGMEHRARFHHGSWFDALPGGTAPFDLIVSNPPYVSAAEMRDLAPEVRDFEPRLALTDEGDGLGCYRAITARAADHLIAGGWLMFEVGAGQGAAVAQMLKARGFVQWAIRPDLEGRDRVVLGQKPPL